MKREVFYKNAEEIVKKFKERKGIFLFGAGQIGSELREFFELYNIFWGYIDNDKEKQKKGCNGKKVYSLEEYLQNKKGWIVVSVSEDKYDVISNQLKQVGLVEKQDYWSKKDFMKDIFPSVSFFCFNKIYVNVAQICLTERCTLHCKKCAHACNFVDITAEDMDLEEVKKSADYFFKNVDIVNEFSLLGGEPFLYKYLAEIIEYIGKKYRHQIMLFTITTNGTIIPSCEIIELCEKYKVTIRVSDYSATLPFLKSKYELLYKKLEKLRLIIWKAEGKDAWFDYGFDSINRGEDIEKLKSVFGKCKTPCREIRGSKYYYCVMARSVSENMSFNIGKDDYLELENLENRNLLFEFQEGYLSKGYLEMCRYCRGTEVKDYPIQAAEQSDVYNGRV